MEEGGGSAYGRPLGSTTATISTVPAVPRAGFGDSESLETEIEQTNQTNNNITPSVVVAEAGLNMQETIWDAALLIGLRKGDSFLLTWFQVIVVLVILSVNVVVQLALVRAIGANLAVSPLTDNAKEAVIAQRLASYQNYDNVESTEVETLGRRLCNQLAYTQMSQLYDDVSGYLAVEGLTGLNWGRIVAWSAMMIFTLSMITEFYRILHQGTHVFLLRSSGAGGVRLSARGESSVIYGMSRLNKVFAFVVVLLPRLLIATSLTFFGLKFIASTLSVEELILNSCALEVVKHVDEFAFKGFATAKLRNVVMRTRFANIRGGRQKTSDGFRFVGVSYLDVVATLARFAFTAAWLALGYYLFLVPFNETVEDFERVLCGGDVDVAWRVHPVSKMPYFTDIVSQSTPDADPLEASALEQFACFSAARGDMIRIRAGFPATASNPNETLINMIQGTSVICDRDTGSQCPERSLSIISNLDTVTDSDHYGEKCHNAEVHMAMLVETCTQEAYAEVAPWFQGRRECGDFAPLCQCDTYDALGFCTYTNLTRIQEDYQISQAWLDIMQSVCPVTCKTCRQTLLGSSPRRTLGETAIFPVDESSGQEMLAIPAVDSALPVGASPNMAAGDERHFEGPLSLPSWAEELKQRMTAMEQLLMDVMQRNAQLEQRGELLERRSRAVEELAQRLSVVEASMT